MKKLTRIVGTALSLSLLTFAPLVADNCCADCCWNPCGWSGDFEIGADAFYWKPMSCPLHYADRIFVSGTTTTVQVQELKSDYDWGVRAFVGYERGCTFAQLSYLYTNPTDHVKSNQGAATAFNVIGVPTQATAWSRGEAQLNWVYQNADLRVGHLLHRRSGCQFGVFGNLRWAYLNNKEMIRGRSENDLVPPDIFSSTTTVKAKFDGVGLGVGALGEFCIWRGLNVFGEFDVMGIIGQRTTPQVENINIATTTGTTITTTLSQFSSNISVIPALDMRLGFNYTYDCWCTTLVAEVGYEINYYWNAIDKPLFTTTSFVPDARNRECSDIGFGGIFAGFRALF
ncbi:MAG: hypothetical protein JSR80_03745 [Verrucomicrobia bacterium]|nr:hypothetical protein [Verrucomicrobiota bacterium]